MRWLIILLAVCLTEKDVMNEGCRQLCYSKGLLGVWDAEIRQCFCGKYWKIRSEPKDRIQLDLSEIKSTNQYE